MGRINPFVMLPHAAETTHTGASNRLLLINCKSLRWSHGPKRMPLAMVTYGALPMGSYMRAPVELEPDVPPSPILEEHNQSSLG